MSCRRTCHCTCRPGRGAATGAAVAASGGARRYRLADSVAADADAAPAVCGSVVDRCARPGPKRPMAPLGLPRPSPARSPDVLAAALSRDLRVVLDGRAPHEQRRPSAGHSGSSPAAHRAGQRSGLHGPGPPPPRLLAGRAGVRRALGGGVAGGGPGQGGAGGRAGAHQRGRQAAGRLGFGAEAAAAGAAGVATRVPHRQGLGPGLWHRRRHQDCARTLLRRRAAWTFA